MRPQTQFLIGTSKESTLDDAYVLVNNSLFRNIKVSNGILILS